MKWGWVKSPSPFSLAQNKTAPEEAAGIDHQQGIVT
jgi:hypothetical protein